MKKEIKKIIEWSLQHTGMYSEDAAALVFRTGMVETGYKYLKQMGGGPAIGFFQLEPNTLYDIIDNYVTYRPELRTDLYALGYEDSDSEIRVMGNIALQAAFCRLVYRRDKHPLPKMGDLIGQAKYWKRVYNTELGKGTIKHFMEMNNG